MIKIVIDNAIPFIKNVFDDVAFVEYHPGDQINSEIVRDADVLIIRTRTKCNSTLLQGSKVSLICTATIGYDHIDTTYCQINGIRWYSMAGCNSNSVAQYVLAAIASLHKRYTLDFRSLVVGVVGMGNVGSKIVHYCTSLGIRVLINDPLISNNIVDLVSFDELKSKSDIITFHVPLIKEGNYPTFQMINYQSFENVKKGAILINTSRGEIVNELDLLELLNKKILGDVILDVWANEPLINHQLLDKSIITTSHIAGYSADGKRNGTVGSVQRVSECFGFKGLEDRIEHPILPEHPIIEIDCNDRTIEDIFSEVILRTYNIEDDSKRLRSNIHNFELLRNSYPNRREFDSYSIIFENDSNNFRNKFEKLGFKVKSYV